MYTYVYIYIYSGAAQRAERLMAPRQDKGKWLQGATWFQSVYDSRRTCCLRGGARAASARGGSAGVRAPRGG